jgi:hypothetical protein
MGSQLTDVASGSDMVVSFRAAYLRAITTAWEHKDYKLGVGRSQFSIPGGMCSHWNILNWSGFRKFLPGNHDLYEDKLSLSNEPQGVGYTPVQGSVPNIFPWSAKILIIDTYDKDGEQFKNPDYGKFDYPVLEREMTAGWAGGKDQFIIVIPPAPSDPADYAAAVAGYLKQFPTLLGYIEGCESKDNWRYASGEPEFLAFSNMLAMALPYCWSKLTVHEYLSTVGHQPFRLNPQEDERFLHLLTTHSLQEQKEFSGHGSKILNKYFGFKNTWAFDFVFLDAEDINATLENMSYEDVQKNLAHPYRIWAEQFYDWDSKEQKPTKFNKIKWSPELKRWHNLFNIVTITLPFDPKMNEDRDMSAETMNVYRANALAVYNNSIAQYPFTCP